MEQNGDFPDLSVVLRKEPYVQIRLGSHDGPPLASCESQVQTLAKMLLQNRPRWIRQLARTPDSWRDLEREIDQEVRQHTGHFLAALLQEASQEEAFLEASEFASRPSFRSSRQRPADRKFGCCVDWCSMSPRFIVRPDRSLGRPPQKTRPNNTRACSRSWRPWASLWAAHRR